MPRSSRPILAAATLLAVALSSASGHAIAGIKDTAMRFERHEARVSPPLPRIQLKLPAAAAPHRRVEALHNRGPIIEMIVNCLPHSGIVTYSKVERLFCSPKSGCSDAFNVAYTRTCAAR